jgi:hypothetical protein
VLFGNSVDASTTISVVSSCSDAQGWCRSGRERVVVVGVVACNQGLLVACDETLQGVFPRLSGAWYSMALAVVKPVVTGAVASNAARDEVRKRGC